jgi:hypothetical protein
VVGGDTDHGENMYDVFKAVFGGDTDHGRKNANRHSEYCNCNINYLIIACFNKNVRAGY